MKKTIITQDKKCIAVSLLMTPIEYIIFERALKLVVEQDKSKNYPSCSVAEDMLDTDADIEEAGK